MVEILLSLGSVFTWMFEWVNDIFEYCGAWTYFIGAFLIYTIYRLILAPIVGGVISSGQSDSVKSIRKGIKARKE